MERQTKFNLQLFAEETPTEGAASVATEPGKPTGQTTEPGTVTEPPKADEPKYTDADVDKIINKKFAEWEKKQEKKVSEAAKLAEMNAQQKAEYERDELQKELDELKRKDTLSEMSKTARKMLSDEGINIGDDLLSRLVTTDADETKTAVDGFVKLFKAAVEDAVKERAKGTTPKIITNNGNAMSEIDKRIAKYEQGAINYEKIT